LGILIAFCGDLSLSWSRKTCNHRSRRRFTVRGKYFFGCFHCLATI
jgi:hypothetical protein